MVRNHSKSAFIVPAIVAATILIFTALGSMFWSDTKHAQQETDFQNSANRLREEVISDISSHETALKSTAGLFSINQYVTYYEFREFYEAIQTSHDTPGVIGMGYIAAVEEDEVRTFIVKQGLTRDFTIRPDIPTDKRYIITYNEPASALRSTWGLNLVEAQPKTVTALENARDTGEVTITPPFILSIDEENESPTGFAMFVPVYRSGEPIDTVEERRAAHIGWTSSPFRAKDLLRTTIKTLPEGYGISVYDSGTKLVSSPVTDPKFFDRESISIGDRSWIIEVAGTPEEADLGRNVPVIIWTLGFVIAALAAAATRRSIIDRENAEHETQEITEALSESEELFQVIAENSSDLVTRHRIDDAQILWASPASERLLGFDPSELIGHTPADFVHPDDVNTAASKFFAAAIGQRVSSEYRFRRIDGEYVWLETTFQLVELPDGRYEVHATSRDISERKQTQDQMAHLAMHDQLTGLANRSLFHDRLRQTMSREKRNATIQALLFVDLDQFKPINDSFGHAAGDQVLKEVGQRLNNAVREHDTVARIAGDEFVVLCEDIENEVAATQVADRIIAALALPYRFGETDVAVTGSVGIAMTDGSGETTPEDFLNQADIALYKAKDLGKNQYCVYRDAGTTGAITEHEIAKGLQNKEFKLFVQPIVNLQTEKVVGGECLLRWEHPMRGMVPPLDFIPLAERTGLIMPLGDWVVREATRIRNQLREHAAWSDKAYLSLNLSAKQIAHPSLLERLGKQFQDDASGLCFEVTETELVHNRVHAHEVLRGLQDAGAKIAVDDFGAGYSSLGYLQDLPVDILKLDRMFVTKLSGENVSESASLIVESVVKLGHAIGFTIVAEGVEEIEEAEILCDVNCDNGQGYLWSRPLPYDDFAEWLDNHEEKLVDIDCEVNEQEEQQ